MVNITIIRLYYISHNNSQGMNIMIPVMIVMILGVRVYISEALGMVGIFSLALPNVTMAHGVLPTTRFPW